MGRPKGGHVLPIPSLEDLQKILDYEPETGLLRWKIDKRRGGVRKGEIAGSKGKFYTVVGTPFGRLRAHKIAWRFIHGERADVLPGPDHIDRDGNNNSSLNLRAATPQQQAFNRGYRLPKTSGLRGATWDKKAQKWRAKTQLNKKTVWIGYFDTPEECHAAFLEFTRANHGEFSPYGGCL